MTEEWVRLRAESAGCTAFILDVSGSAEAAWPAIAALVRGIGSELPAGGERRLYFLGCGSRYPLEEFAAKGEGWRAAHRGRGSFVAPVFERLTDVPRVTAVVLGSGPLFDLEDWLETPPGRGAVFVRAGEGSLTGGRREELEPDLDALRRRLVNPVVRVEIGARTAFPLGWSSAAYRLEEGRLVGEGGNAFAVDAGFVKGPGAPVEAVAVLADGERRRLELEPCAPAAPEGAWLPLTAAEGEVFRRGVREGSYACPHCGEAHLAAALACLSGPTAGQGIYPSLAGRRGFVLLREGKSGVEYQPHRGLCLRVAEDVVAVLTDEGAELVGFGPEVEAWAGSGRSLVQYHWLGQRTYAIVL